MRHLLLLIVILLLILVGVGPAITGFLFKHHYYHLIEVINNSGRANIVVLSYDEGWLNSHAKIRITPGEFKNEPNAPHLILENDIAHGPILKNTVDKSGFTLGYATIKTTINFADSSKRFYDERVNPETGIEINTLAKLSGLWHNKLILHQLIVSKPYLGKLTWDGLNGDVNFTLAGNRVTDIAGVLKFGALLIEADADNPYFQQFSIQSLTYDKTTSRLPDGLWAGKTLVLIPNITMTLSNAMHIVLSDLTIKSETGKASDASLYRLQNEFSLKHLEVPSALSSFPTLDNIFLKIDINDLDAKATKNLITHFKMLETSQTPAKEMQTYLTLLSKAITPKTNFQKLFNFTCSAGTFKSQTDMMWEAPVSFQDPMDIIKKSTLSINIEVSVPLANKLIAAYFENIDIHDDPHVPLPPQRDNELHTAKESFNQAVAVLFQQNKLTMPIAMQVIGIADQHLSQDAFNTSIKSLGLPPDAISQLNVAYQQYQAQLAKIATTPTPVEAEAKRRAMQKQTQEMMVTNLINNLVSQGFIKIENNNYLSDIRYQNNVITVNGKPFTPDMINPGPVNIGPVLPQQQQNQPQAPQLGAPPPTQPTMPGASVSPQAVPPQPPPQ